MRMALASKVQARLPRVHAGGSRHLGVCVPRAARDPDFPDARSSPYSYETSRRRSAKNAAAQNVESIADDGRDVVDDVAGSTARTSRAAARDVSNAAENAAESAKSVADDAVDVVEDVVDNAVDGFAGAVDNADEFIDAASSFVEDAARTTVADTVETYASANEPVSTSRAGARETPQEWGPPSRGTAPPPPPPVEELPQRRPDSRFEDIKKVLVAGATGGVGRRVVAELVAKGVKVVALVRDPGQARSRLPGVDEGVTLVKGDVYQYSSLPRALHGCDAVICATGANEVLDPLGPFSTDYSGTVNLVAASQRAGVKRFVFVTSIGTDDPIINPLNLFWGILFWKKRAEEHLQRSGLTYTIVRPGGLVSGVSTRSNVTMRGTSARGEGNVVMAAAGTYGIPPKKPAGSIKRSKVAQCCVEALVQPAAVDKVVEIISERSAPLLGWDDLFEGVRY